MNISDNIEETGDNMNNGEIEDNEDIEDMIYGNNDYQLQYDINESRVLFDNDVIGRRTMESKLKRKKTVFMWKKFIKENALDVKIKDFNDLIRHCYFHKNGAYKKLDKYFTTSPYDILNI